MYIPHSRARPRPSARSSTRCARADPSARSSSPSCSRSPLFGHELALSYPVRISDLLCVLVCLLVRGCVCACVCVSVGVLVCV